MSEDIICHEICPNHPNHDWQAVAVPIQVQGIGLAPNLIIQFFRVCPWCKTSEDMPSRQLSMKAPNPILS